MLKQPKTKAEDPPTKTSIATTSPTAGAVVVKPNMKKSKRMH
jgi:hypothetical protein